MIKKTLWLIVAIFSMFIGLYPIFYLFADDSFGILGSKSKELLANSLWKIGFFSHIIFGGLALFIGWILFSSKIREKYLYFHRNIGKIYVISALLSSTAAILIGFFTTGGFIPALGFICLGLIWFFSTLRAYKFIRNYEIEKHETAVVYSYAACFSAVTLRIWMPILIGITQDFVIAYKIVAWLCWVPNLIVAFFLVKYIEKGRARKLSMLP